MEHGEAIARLQRGDIGGLEELMLAYQVPAVRAAYLMLQDRALAEDIVQAAFVRAFERIAQFDAGRPFGPWFLRSVVNDALTVAVRRERAVAWDASIPEALPALVEPGPAFDEQLIAAETSAAIWAAVRALPPEQRAAIVLRYYLELSEAEIAARLDCPPGTGKSRLHAAKRRLRALLPAWVRPGGGEPAHIHVQPAPLVPAGKQEVGHGQEHP